MSKVKRKATASGSSSAPSSPSSAHGGTLISPEDALREFAEQAFLSSDATFVDTFLLTYRTFQSDEGSSVLTLWAQRLAEEMKKKKNHSHSEQLLNFMKGWIRNYFSDFGSSQRNTVLQTIGDLCGAQLANEFKLILFQGNSALQKASARNSPSPPRRKGVSVRGRSPLGHHHSNSHELKRMLSDPITKKIPNKRATEALLSSIASVVSFNFLETSPGLLAYELSRLESGIFRSILGREFLDKGWQQEHHSHSRNLQDMIRRFNEVSFWVPTEILQHVDVKSQVDAITHFIKIAAKCHSKYHNYNASMGILSGLELICIQRLKDAWGRVSIRSLGQLGKLRHVMESESNFRKYRSEFAAINEEKTPKIPYIPVLLKDFIFIEDGNSKYDEDGRINMSRMQLLATQVANIRKIQQHCFYKKKQGVTEGMRKYLANLNVITDEEELHQLSLKRQPKNIRKRSVSDGDLRDDSNDTITDDKAERPEKLSKIEKELKAAEEEKKQQWKNRSDKWQNFEENLKRKSMEPFLPSSNPNSLSLSTGGSPLRSKSKELVSQEMVRLLAEKKGAAPLPPQAGAEGVGVGGDGSGEEGSGGVDSPSTARANRPKDPRTMKSTSEIFKPRNKSENDLRDTRQQQIQLEVKKTEETQRPVLKGSLEGFTVASLAIPPQSKAKKKKTLDNRKASSLDSKQRQTLVAEREEREKKKKKSPRKHKKHTSTSKKKESEKDKDKEKDKVKKEKEKEKMEVRVVVDGRRRKCSVDAHVTFEEFLESIRKCQVTATEALEVVHDGDGEDKGSTTVVVAPITFLYEDEKEEKVRVCNEEDFMHFFEIAWQRDTPTQVWLM